MMFLRDVSIHADKAIVSTHKDGFVGKFARDVTGCINLFLRLIHRKIETAGTAKLALTFTNNKSLVKERHHMYPEQSDVLIFTWLFQFDKYVEASELNKKKMIFSAMTDCVKYLATQYEWDTRPLNEARKQAEQDDYQFNGYLKHSWSSPDSKWRVRIYYECRLEFLEFSCCLFRNRSKTELFRKKMGRVVPAQGGYRIEESNGKWLSNTQFELISPTFQRIEWGVDFAEIMTGSNQ
ncbi:hypothetical protein CA11_02250 [Gimesia maris]|uniref:hypothetical protein n=1 Tax=Gimesia maris TaxID=122 RepID=UPI00118A3E61|nr:hypothetical protein [Gimesia maris]QDU12446.1 hypothetical protein CA11_02250 [Gimesia maris]